MKHLPNVLVVDDDLEQLNYLKSILKGMSLNLILAASGKIALEKTAGIDLALAIIDVRMPNMDGFELTKRMNQARPDEKVPIIFLTGDYYIESKIYEGYSSGAVDYIFKPVDTLVFRSKIQVFLELYRQKCLIIQKTEELKKSADDLQQTNTALRNSELKYRSYVDHAPDGVIISDRKGKFIEVNEAACILTGYGKDELIGLSFENLLHETHLTAGKTFLKSLVRDGNAGADLMMHQKNGTEFWVSIEAVRLTEERYLGFAKNITLRKQAEIKIMEQYRFLNTLLDTIPNPVFQKDLDGRYRIFNAAFERFLGKHHTEIYGKSSFEVSPREEAEEFTRRDKELIDKGGIQKYEWKVTGKGGKKNDLILDKALIRDENGQINGIIGIISDITTRKAAEEEVLSREKELKAILNSLPEAIFLMDKDGTIIVNNGELGRQLGLDPDELKGRKISEIIPAALVKTRKPKIDSVFKTGEPLSFEDEYAGRCYKSSIYPVLAESGKTVRVSILSLDVTERKIAEQALKVSDEKYKTLLDASPDGILLIDLNGIITEVSEIGLELFGADSREELVGMHFLRFVPPNEKSTLKEIIEKTMNEGLAQNIELKIRKKKDSIFVSETSTTLIQGPRGIPLSFMIIIRDISQRKKIETKQLHADRMANLGEMASGIAHEINQPLNIISMVVDKILFDAAKTETIGYDFLKRKTEKIFENITRMRNIIDHIRAFSRSHDDYVLTAFDINKSIENATTMIMEQFKHLGIRLNLELDKSIPQVFGNTFKFEQVIVNLLVNAKDAVLEKKNKMTEPYEMIIGIRSFHEDQSLVVELADNGIGISTDDINNVILPFYTTKDEGKGTGLGLSICYQIIKEMDGTIEITSDKTSGTRVKLVLDYQKKKQS
ncbi:MAG: PAS domain S-box protein [Bacteroidota bacterium]